MGGCRTGWLAFAKIQTPQVTYFKKWRVAEHNKKQRLAQLEAQGAQAMEITGGPGGPPAGR